MCDGPTEKLSTFVDQLLQAIAKEQKSYLKDSTDFINFIENIKRKSRQTSYLFQWMKRAYIGTYRKRR